MPHARRARLRHRRGDASPTRPRLHALANRAALQTGETLLVLGAAGGVGIAAVELGQALGARVIAAASTDEKLAFCRGTGRA